MFSILLFFGFIIIWTAFALLCFCRIGEKDIKELYEEMIKERKNERNN